MSGANIPTGRFDLPPTGSDLKSRDKLNQLPGRIGTMRGWLVDQVKALRGFDFTEKKDPKKPEVKPPEKTPEVTTEEDEGKKKKKDEKQETQAA